MKRDCAHVCVDIDERGETSYAYCPFPAVTTVSGVDYCRNHSVENDRRERIHNLIAEIDSNRPQS